MDVRVLQAQPALAEGLDVLLAPPWELSEHRLSAKKQSDAEAIKREALRKIAEIRRKQRKERCEKPR